MFNRQIYSMIVLGPTGYTYDLLLRDSDLRWPQRPYFILAVRKCNP